MDHRQNMYEKLPNGFASVNGEIVQRWKCLYEINENGQYVFVKLVDLKSHAECEQCYAVFERPLEWRRTAIPCPVCRYQVL